HASHVRLQAGGHHRVDAVPHLVRGVLHHHHGPVLQVGETLAGLAALLDDVQRETLPRHERRLDGVGELVDVEHPHSLQSSHPAQVVVGGYQVVVAVTAQVHQAVVHRQL